MQSELEIRKLKEIVQGVKPLLAKVIWKIGFFLMKIYYR
jgi:hypothetical protein